jgi:ParB family chromosome partitioning protein
MMTQISMKPTGWLKPDPKNPRKLPDDTDPRKEQWEKDLDRLGDDMLARGVLVPLLARLDATIIDGWRRWLAALRKGIKELPVIVTDTPETEIPGIQLATVFHKADLTGAEKWLACCGILQAHPDWQLKNLAEFLHLDASMVTRLLSPSKCIQAWQEALAAGKVGISDCYAASKLNETEQAELLRLKLTGASRDAIERAGRKARAASAPAVRMSKVKIAMPHGASVVVSGNDLSMPDLVELLSETLKEARKAAEQYDVKTFQAMMRDKAKG